MEQSVKEAWKRLLDEARRELPDATVRTWLEPAVPIALDGDRLVLGAPDQFAAEWNESKHAALLARAAERVFGRPTRVIFRVQEERQHRPQMDFFVAPQGGTAVAERTTATTPLNERYSFDTFVVGKSNELAAAAAHAVVEAPGKTYNPLFIYGATGLGKTHLMQAIAHAVLGRRPETRILYVGAEQFINEVIESIQARTMPEFRRRYRSDVDLLLVDDVHFLEGKEMTQDEFFHTFNALFEARKQMVLTSDRPPKEIPGLEDRLISRFEWGMVADIGQPDLEHRIAILRKTSSRAASSSCCCSLPRRTARSPSSWPARRSPTRSARARTPQPTAAARCRASTACRRSWRGAGGSRPRGCAPRRAPRRSRSPGRWRCTWRATCSACSSSRSARRSAAGTTPPSFTAWTRSSGR